MHRQQVPLPSSSSCSFLQARITKTACKEWEQGAVTKEERHVTKEERQARQQNKNSILHPRYNYIGDPYLCLVICVAVAVPYAKAASSLLFLPFYVSFS